MIDRPPSVGACPVCAATAVVDLLVWEGVPANNAVFFASEVEARAYPRGTLRLVACEKCGFLFNADFDSMLTRYDASYVETQALSERHGHFVDQLARSWVDRHELIGRPVLEVGCGRDADFLRRFRAISAGRCTGVDPAVDTSLAEPGLELVAEPFDERWAGHSASALICRHTLEHIPAVADFLRTCRIVGEVNPGAVFLFEVPDTVRILEQRAFWDIYYEHCSYFTIASLRTAFELAGFAVERSVLVFDGQYIVLEAKIGTQSDRNSAVQAAGVVDLARRFAVDVVLSVDRVRAELYQRTLTGPLLIWQASSKAVSLLTLLAGSVDVAGLVDINSDKRGRFIVGSGHRVFAPEDVAALAPKHIVVMNPVYVDEVSRLLRTLRVDASVTSIEDLIDPAADSGAST